jgi:hypothetical protein
VQAVLADNPIVFLSAENCALPGSLFSKQAGLREILSCIPFEDLYLRKREERIFVAYRTNCSICSE